MSHREPSMLKQALNGNAHKHLLNAKGKISEGAENAFQGMIEMLELAGYQVKKHTLQQKDHLALYLKEHPFKSMGIALAAGGLLALLLKR